MNTQKRRQAILSLIASRRIGTQEQLVEALRSQGVEASQASVSRDITWLRLVKVDGGWTAPPHERSALDPFEERIASRLIAVAAAGDHLLVLKTPPGDAQGVALALDRLEPEGLVGTVAGDDTILAAMSTRQAGLALLLRLQKLGPPL